MKNRKAFTLIEVLISIGLLGIIIVALFSTVTML
ncbi:MAG: prepilin-type N-terminal cleavage/methylation domain-containing protein, partial [Sulfurovum sp.]|nr:prepilin-type N-terminal cleavage/methylation domain-containing protein [Sulfurovum sp.]